MYNNRKLELKSEVNLTFPIVFVWVLVYCLTKTGWGRGLHATLLYCKALAFKEAK